MNALRLSLNSRPRIARLALFGTVLCACACAAHAQPAQTPPYAEYQYATITGSDNTITVSQLPVVINTGNNGTIYWDLTLLFDVDSSGNVTLAPGYPQAVKAPRPDTCGLVAGTYVGPSTIYNGTMIINLAGPGVAAGGATEWTISAGSGANVYTYPDSGMLYVTNQPISQNPLGTRLKNAKISNATYNAYCGWGTGSAVGNGDWPDNGLIAVSQVANTITITSFTYGASDRNEPVDQVTYTHQ